MRILVVDDERAVRDSVRRALVLNGYEVNVAEDGHEALRRLALAQPDALVLDLLMPGLDGLEVCRRLREAGEKVPVLMLTARDDVSDRVAGLDAGPTTIWSSRSALQELLARLRALTRRSSPRESGDRSRNGSSELLQFGDLSLDRATRDVWRGERRMELTRTEFLLLELFLAHPRQVLTRAQIFEHVWGFDFGPTSTSIAVYVGYLRRKTEAAGEPRLIQTVRGVGYTLRDP